MTTNFTNTADPTLQKLGDAIVNSIRRANGTFVAAGPNAFTDRLGTTVLLAPPASSVDDSGGYEIVIRVNPGGGSAFAKVRPSTPMGAQAVEGAIDIPTLATKLA